MEPQGLIVFKSSPEAYRHAFKYQPITKDELAPGAEVVALVLKSRDGRDGIQFLTLLLAVQGQGVYFDENVLTTDFDFENLPSEIKKLCRTDGAILYDVACVDGVPTLAVGDLVCVSVSEVLPGDSALSIFGVVTHPLDPVLSDQGTWKIRAD